MKHLCCTCLFVVVFFNALTIFGKIFDLHVSGVYKDLLTAPEAKESHIRFSSTLRGSNHYSALLGTKGFLSCETFVHVSCIWPIVWYYLRFGLCGEWCKEVTRGYIPATAGIPRSMCCGGRSTGIWFNYSDVQTNLILYLTLLRIESSRSLIFLPKPSFLVNFVQGTFRCLSATTLADTFLTQFRRG